MSGRQLAAYGLRCTVPVGWDVRIERRQESAIPTPGSAVPLGGYVPMGGFVHPTLHAASSALPSARGDYGSGYVERMTPNDVFVSLLEFDVEAGETAMFLSGQPRSLSPSEFHPNAQQRIRKGMCGTQRFFTQGGRAFSLYVVMGSWLQRGRLVHQVNTFLSGIGISPK
ncbi:MAG: hypothetical protein ACKOYM_02705 [Actinomycetes bacterium]